MPSGKELKRLGPDHRQTEVDAWGDRCGSGYLIGYRFELYFSQKYG